MPHHVRPFSAGSSCSRLDVPLACRQSVPQIQAVLCRATAVREHSLEARALAATLARKGVASLVQAARHTSWLAGTAWQAATDTKEVAALVTRWAAEATEQKAKALEEEERAAAKLLQDQARASEAVQLLKRRSREGSLPEQRRDGFKLGLVVEGGGMRGAVSGGGLQALHDLGLRDCFDAVYGSSAGAINATYFLTGQREGVDIYSQDIANAGFVDLRRLLRKDESQAPALDLSFLLDNVMENVKPLDWQAVVDSPIPLNVVASCLDTLQPVLLENFSDTTDLKECLRASAMVPQVAGDPITHRGRRMVDAAVFETIPFRAAIADGCTHVIALATRPPAQGAFVAKLVDDAVATLVKKAVLTPEYMKQAWAAELEYAKAFGATTDEVLLQALKPGSHDLPVLAGCHVFPIFPGAAAMYSPLCIDAATILHGVADGRSAVMNIFGSLRKPAVDSHTLPAAAPTRQPVLASGSTVKAVA